MYESEDPDPYKNVTDPQHWYCILFLYRTAVFRIWFLHGIDGSGSR